MGMSPSRLASINVAALALFMLQPSSAHADPCVKTKVSGSSCQKLSVEFDVSACSWAAPEGDEKTVAPVSARVICKGSSVTARGTHGEQRMEAEFTKSDDGWGSVRWISSGPVRTFARSTASEPSSIPGVAVAQLGTATVGTGSAAATSAPVLVASNSSSAEASASAPAASSAAPSAISMSGFIDMRLTGVRSADPAANEKSRSGYLFEDGAIYLSGTRDRFDFFIDLPLSRNGGASNADVSIAKTKAQAFGKLRFTDELSLTFGQFDTIYGFELNDSKDRVFGVTGFAYNQTLPIVHSGAFLTWARDGFTARLMAANPADRQVLGSTAGDSSTEYGATLGYANSMIRGQVGTLVRSMTDLADKSSQRTLIDSVFGFSYGMVDVDFQYSMVSNPQKNTLTVDATDKESDGSAAMMIVTLKIRDDLKVSGRIERLDKDPAGLNYPQVDAMAAVVNYQVQDGVTLRAEWNDFRVKRDSATSAYDESRWDIGAVVTF
jgi:hypothetical protein